MTASAKNVPAKTRSLRLLARCVEEKNMAETFLAAAVQGLKSNRR
jgi:hypothetical protein